VLLLAAAGTFFKDAKVDEKIFLNAVIRQLTYLASIRRVYHFCCGVGVGCQGS
jgi:hypothetical protein